MDNLSVIKAQRSSSETLINHSAHGATKNGDRINAEPIFPNLISDLLADGHSVKFRAPGDSMYPTICDGDEITIAPIDAVSLNKGDIILYWDKSGVTAHRVIRIVNQGARHAQHSTLKSHSSDFSPQPYFILRGDAAIVFDEPVSADQILGKVTLVERQGRCINPYSFKATICSTARRLAARLKKFLLFQS